jgi:hypothetical protein
MLSLSPITAITGPARTLGQHLGKALKSVARRRGCRKSCHLSDLGILADQTAEPVPPQNLDVYVKTGRCGGPAGGFCCSAPVRPVSVVVIDVLVQNRSR